MPLSLLKNSAKFCIYNALRESNAKSRPVPQGSVTDVEDAIFRSHTLDNLEKELEKNQGKLLLI